MKLNNEDIIKMLKDRNISITDNRIKIIECLDDNNQHFHAISDISDHVKLNTKSIYNNIKILISAGLVDSLSVGGVVKYALNDNLSGDKAEIHLINQNGDIDHLEIDPKILKNIEKGIKKTGKEPVSIKIFANIK